jgi:hypothetical protein
MEDYKDIISRGREVCNKFPQATLRQSGVFSAAHKGSNIITPERIALLSLAKARFVVEVAWGRGMSDNTLYGITVMQYHDGMRRTDLSQCTGSVIDLEEILTGLNEVIASNG